MLAVSVEAALSMCRTLGDCMCVDMLDACVYGKRCVCAEKGGEGVLCVKCLVDVVRDMVVYVGR